MEEDECVEIHSFGKPFLVGNEVSTLLGTEDVKEIKRRQNKHERKVEEKKHLRTKIHLYLLTATKYS